MRGISFDGNRLSTWRSKNKDRKAILFTLKEESLNGARKMLLH
jgi:hypothetical protein